MVLASSLGMTAFHTRLPSSQSLACQFSNVIRHSVISLTAPISSLMEHFLVHSHGPEQFQITRVLPCELKVPDAIANTRLERCLRFCNVTNVNLKPPGIVYLMLTISKHIESLQYNKIL